MKTIAMATSAALCLLSMNSFADGRTYSGFSVDYVRSTQDGSNNSSSAATMLRTVRPDEHYGYEMQFGLIGVSGPFTSNTFVDVSAVGLVPVGESRWRFYGKAGLADMYSQGSLGVANNLGLTYGAGVEFVRASGDIRVGFQHFNVGNNTLSPSLSTTLFGLTLLLN